MDDLATVSLEAVFNVIPVGLAVVDGRRRIVLMNDGFRESLGLPADAFPPGTLVEHAVRASALGGVFGPSDTEDPVQAIISADSTRLGLLRRWTFAGRSFDLFNAPLPDDGYVVMAVETTNQTTTARMGAESALAQSATALTMLRIGLAIFDSKRALQLANPQFAVLLALPPDRLVTGFTIDSMLKLMEVRGEFATPEGLDFIAALRYAGQGAWTSRRWHANGRSIDVMLDRLPDGGCIISISDITPQAHAEDEAQRRARLLDLVLLNIPHGICVYGADRRVSMFNDTYNKVMEGAPLQLGDALSDVVRRRAEAGEYGDGETEAVIAEQVSFSRVHPQMRRRVRPNGTAIDIRTAPLPDGGHISVVTDISALVHAEAELHRRAAEMSTMLAHIRHGIMLWGPDKRLLASNPVAADLLDLPGELLTPGRTDAEELPLLPNLAILGLTASGRTRLGRCCTWITPFRWDGR